MSAEVEEVKVLTRGSPISIADIVQFVAKYENVPSFPELSISEKSDLWDGSFHFLQQPKDSEERDKAFLFINSLRILSRDKPILEHAFTTEHGEFLLKNAKIINDEKFDSNDEKIVYETLKVLYNVVLQNDSIRNNLISSGILGALLVKINELRAIQKFNFQPKYIFWFKLIAVLTGHCLHTVPKLRSEFKGLEILSEFLEKLANLESLYDGLHMEGVCETLKILYNFCHDLQEPCEGDVREFFIFQMKITKEVRKILLHPSASPVMEYKINGHAVDLLTTVPTDCLPLLFQNSLEDDKHLDFSAINAVVSFLREKLENPDAGNPEVILPVFVLLVRLGRNNRNCRKHLKSLILPPLRKKDVEEMSQVGETLRNRLVSLFTSPYDSIAHLSASFVFILCKERFGQMIKYTGYGNAAGLFADRGLLFGQNKTQGDYSDASSDSDTEEYKEIEHMINDVTCRIEAPKANPMEGLSEEEKEFKAMQLVEVFDKMTKEPGLIRPAIVGPDGKPMEVEHVLQLINGQKIPTRDSDSD